jgi:hypothetical protein
VRASRVPLEPLVERRLAADEGVKAVVLPDRLGAAVGHPYWALKTLGFENSFASP